MKDAVGLAWDITDTSEYPCTVHCYPPWVKMGSYWWQRPELFLVYLFPSSRMTTIVDIGPGNVYVSHPGHRIRYGRCFCHNIRYWVINETFSTKFCRNLGLCQAMALVIVTECSVRKFRCPDWTLENKKEYSNALKVWFLSTGISPIIFMKYYLIDEALLFWKPSEGYPGHHFLLSS